MGMLLSFRPTEGKKNQGTHQHGNCQLARGSGHLHVLPQHIAGICILGSFSSGRTAALLILISVGCRGTHG